jgi:hypothetical protein
MRFASNAPRHPTPRTAPPPRRRRVRIDLDDPVATERLDLIRFDWPTTKGIQPVILVSRRWLD